VIAAACITSCIDLEKLAAQHLANELIDLAPTDQRQPAPCHRLDLQRLVGAGADIGEHQAGHALRLTDGKRQCRTAAERKPDDRRPLNFERVENANKIAGEMTRRIFGCNGRRVGQPVATLIASDDAEAFLQRQHLVKPHAPAAGETVQQYHGRTFAGIADGDSQAADLDFFHAVSACPKRKSRTDMIGNRDNDKHRIRLG
jgi:hypothetical protein